MAEISIFQDEAFSVDALLAVINEDHVVPGQIAAAGSRLQKQHGIADSPDEHFRDAQRIANGSIDPVVLRLMVDNAADTIDWLMDLGFAAAPGATEGRG